MRKTSLLLAGLMVLAVAALAEDTRQPKSPAAVFLGGEVYASWSIVGDSAPSPACHFHWEASPAAGEDYHNSAVFTEEPCLSAWEVHCDRDSLSYRGSWRTENDPTDYSWNFTTIDLEITAWIAFTDAVRLYAASDSKGVLEADTHLVVIKPDGGEGQILLGPDPGGSVKTSLEPGIYSITLIVDVTEHHTHYDYLAGLRVWWEDAGGVSVQPETWSGIKARYR